MIAVECGHYERLQEDLGSWSVLQGQNQQETSEFVVMLVVRMGEHYERRGMRLIEKELWLSDEMLEETKWIALR